MGGSGLLKKYNGSIAVLLSTMYPKYDWLPWRFEMCPRGYWDDVNNQIKFINWVSKQLNIKQMSDWYKITHKVLK
jgi:hypothetical protein